VTAKVPFSDSNTLWLVENERLLSINMNFNSSCNYTYRIASSEPGRISDGIAVLDVGSELQQSLEAFRKAYVNTT
jgi:hypothetical protein